MSQEQKYWTADKPFLEADLVIFIDHLAKFTSVNFLCTSLHAMQRFLTNCLM